MQVDWSTVHIVGSRGRHVRTVFLYFQDPLLRPTFAELEKRLTEMAGKVGSVTQNIMAGRAKEKNLLYQMLPAKVRIMNFISYILLFLKQNSGHETRIIRVRFARK